MIDWNAMTDAEIARELELGRVVQDQRIARTRIPEQVERLARQYLAAENVEPEEPWRAPSGAHNAYPKGWKVQHNGKMWESTTPSNVWEPGVSGWIETTATDPNAPAPEWITPTGAHDAYGKSAMVTYGGRTWRSEMGNNVWAPGVHGWVIVEPPAEPEAGVEAWVQPVGATDAYPIGSVVSHNGMTWVSEVDENVWVPGEYGWVEQV